MPKIVRFYETGGAEVLEDGGIASRRTGRGRGSTGG